MTVSIANMHSTWSNSSYTINEYDFVGYTGIGMNVSSQIAGYSFSGTSYTSGSWSDGRGGTWYDYLHRYYNEPSLLKFKLNGTLVFRIDPYGDVYARHFYGENFGDAHGNFRTDINNLGDNQTTSQSQINDLLNRVSALEAAVAALTP